MLRSTLTLLIPLLLAAAVRTQQASFTPFGTACTFPGEATPAIGARGLPRLGTSFAVTYRGPNRNSSASQQRLQPWLITGLGTFPNPVAVPPGVFPMQPPGCFVFVLPDIVLPMPLSPSGQAYQSSVTLTIPNDPRVLGATWFHQWFAIFEQCGFAGCNPFWAVTSDAARAVAGT